MARPTETQLRIADHPDPDQTVITKFGDPLPRQLPDGRVIVDPDALRETADMTDEEAMAWLDIPEIQT